MLILTYSQVKHYSDILLTQFIYYILEEKIYIWQVDVKNRGLLLNHDFVKPYWQYLNVNKSMNFTGNLLLALFFCAFMLSKPLKNRWKLINYIDLGLIKQEMVESDKLNSVGGKTCQIFAKYLTWLEMIRAKMNIIKILALEIMLYVGKPQTPFIHYFFSLLLDNFCNL